MKITAFNETLCKELGAMLGSGFDVSVNQIDRLNGVSEDKICIHRKGKLIAPCISTGRYYDRYQEGTLAMEEIIEGIYHEFLNLELDFPNGEKIDCLDSWENARHHILPRLVNSEKNMEMLRISPSIPFCDLSIVFYLQVPIPCNDGEVDASLCITGKIMERFGKNLDDLYGQALNNLEKRGVQIMSLTDLIFKRSGFGEINTPEISGMPEMYVLTNETCKFGAAVILLDSVKEKLAGIFETDAYILPSSVHELICYPAQDDADKKRLLRMVREVNRDHVSEEDWLSDHLYLFRKSDGSVSRI